MLAAGAKSSCSSSIKAVNFSLARYPETLTVGSVEAPNGPLLQPYEKLSHTFLNNYRRKKLSTTPCHRLRKFR